ncbi:hypothetical protein PENSPDRAFT_633282 [Peniophora sp. CONT]|nr:hypothetical protein PENSPDRAFT_633282 [Peniophora sp. CONT]
MSLVSIHSSVGLLGVFPPHPSAHSLQWTAEGQLAFLGKNAIYILTPALGLNIDVSSAVKNAPSKLNTVTTPLPWLKTVIEQDKRNLYYHWPSDSQEWGTASLGSLDLCLRALTTSPSLLASDKPYVIAVITSNMQLSLWIPLKDHLRGQWTLLKECTLLLRDIASQAARTRVHQTLHAQVGCCSWSSQPLFSDPAPLCDGSLLALGSRAGSIILLQVSEGTPSSLEHVATLQVSDHWVTHLAWNEWTLSAPQQARATLACGVADGSIILVEVTQTLHAEAASQLGHIYRLEVQTNASEPIYAADKKTTTGLQWVTLPARGAVLVFFKPGLVHLWSLQHAEELWSGSRVFRLQTQKTSASSSFLHPVSGVSYIAKYDMLVLSLQDGSFHAVYQMTTEPTLVSPEPTLPTSSAMSSLSRTIFGRCEEKPVKKTDLSVVDGMTSFNGSSTFIWTCESLCPTDFSYKADAQRTTNIITADIWSENDPELLTHQIHQVLSLPPSTSGRAPLDLLRPIIFGLQNDEHLLALFPRLLEVLNAPIPMLLPETYAEARELTPELRREVRDNIGKHLLGSQRMIALRLRLSLADYCWRRAPDDELRTQCSSAASLLLGAVSHSIQQVLIDHLSAILNITTKEDLPFVYRVVIQCLLPGAPPSLSESAQILANRATERGQQFSSGQDTNDLEESCPACGLAVPYNDVSSATCPNGHQWMRCSITSFILSTPMVRTCIGCTRKAFLPPIRKQAKKTEGEGMDLDGPPADDEPDVSHLPPAARSWVVQELLRAASRCLFCGNSFVSLL